MYSVRVLTEEDYPVLCRWWKENRFPAPPQDCLPSNGTGGIMVSKGEIDICAGFIYFTNSKLSWIEFPVADFNYRGNDRAEALQFLINELTGIAQRQGFKAVFSSVKNQNLINHFDACGFTKNKNTTEVIKVFSYR